MEDDLVDATYICRTFEAARAWEAERGRPAIQKPLREILWFVWQAPRLPRPLIRGKYPASGHWTLAARDAYRADPRCPLVIEHVVPLTLLIRELLDQVVLDPGRLAARLRDCMQLCVVTPEENTRLAVTGLARSLPRGVDLWERYRLAGIDSASIGPLISGPSTASA